MKQKRSRILLTIVFVLILLSVAATYYKTIILRDFVIIDDLDESMLEEE